MIGGLYLGAYFKAIRYVGVGSGVLDAVGIGIGKTDGHGDGFAIGKGDGDLGGKGGILRFLMELESGGYGCGGGTGACRQAAVQGVEVGQEFFYCAAEAVWAVDDGKLFGELGALQGNDS